MVSSDDDAARRNKNRPVKYQEIEGYQDAKENWTGPEYIKQLFHDHSPKMMPDFTEDIAQLILREEI